MIDFDSKNKSNYFTLNIGNNPIKNNIEKNIYMCQNEENECLNIISKEQEQENYIVNDENNNTKNPISEKKQKINSTSLFIHKNSRSLIFYGNNNSSKNLFGEPDIYANSKEEEHNRFIIVQPIKIKQKELEKEKIKKEKEYSLIMNCISLLLLIKFPPIGILFFFSWMIKKHKKRMIIIIVVLIILVVFFSTIIYIFYWKRL